MPRVVKTHVQPATPSNLSHPGISLSVTKLLEFLKQEMSELPLFIYLGVVFICDFLNFGSLPGKLSMQKRILYFDCLDSLQLVIKLFKFFFLL